MGPGKTTMKAEAESNLSVEEKRSLIQAALNGTSPEFLCSHYRITLPQYQALCNQILASLHTVSRLPANKPTNAFVLKVLGATCLLAFVFVMIEIPVRQTAYDYFGIFLNNVVGEKEIHPNKVNHLLLVNIGVFTFLFVTAAALFILWGRLVTPRRTRIQSYNVVSYFFAILLGAFKTLELASLIRVLHKDPFWIHSLMVGVAAVFILTLAIDFFVKFDSARSLDFISETLRLLKGFVDFSNRKIFTEMVYGLLLGAIMVSVLSLVITGLDNSINYLFIHKINRITPS